MNPATKPWDYYSRAPRKAGWTFPLGQRGLQAALERADSRVMYLSLGGGYDGGPYGLRPVVDPRSLVRAWWFADGHPERGARFDADGQRTGWAGLDLYSVRSGDAARARDLLLGGVLSEAVGWIAAIRDRGEAWQATDHEFLVLLDEGIASRREH